MKLIYGVVIFMSTLIGAMTGLGGGVIIKPMLDFINYHDVSSISFYSACAVLMMSVYSVYRHSRSKTQYDVRLILVVSLGAAFGGIIGAELFSKVIELLGKNCVARIQSVSLIIMISGVMTTILINPKSKNIDNNYFVFLIGVLLGLVASFLGIGGGPLNVLVFTILFGYNFKSATIYSIATIMFSQIMSLFTMGYSKGFSHFDLSYLWVILLCGLLGGVVGTSVGKKVSERQLKLLFNAVMVLLIIVNLINYIKV